MNTLLPGNREGTTLPAGMVYSDLWNSGLQGGVLQVRVDTGSLELKYTVNSGQKTQQSDQAFAI